MLVSLLLSRNNSVSVIEDVRCFEQTFDEYYGRLWVHYGDATENISCHWKIDGRDGTVLNMSVIIKSLTTNTLQYEVGDILQVLTNISGNPVWFAQFERRCH